jgi:DNA uptake protein ComE-like DNA-binding protein
MPPTQTHKSFCPSFTMAFRIRHHTSAGPLICALLLLNIIPCFANPDLESFPNCQFVDETWADGDSFPVRFPDGTVRTIRLYGVDCLESSVEGSDSNARRLRDQKRWFGIPSMQTAHTLGIDGKTETKNQLSKPFTVHTAFADARGDSCYQRIYGFVTTSTGHDLSELLVSKGLARAFGVARQRPEGTTGEEWREHLKDLEIIAAKKDLGAWSKTDWNELPAERSAARLEEAEIAAVKGTGTKSPPSTPIDLNTASRDELLSLPGIGEVMALRLIEARPFSSIDGLLEVPGIGDATFERLAPFVSVAKQTKPR